MKVKRWLPALVLLSACVHAEDPEQLYQRSCTFCHEQGAANAPRRGDSEAWAQRLEKGMDQLLVSARTGFRQMPPRGLCANCSDADFEALILYMSKPAH